MRAGALAHHEVEGGGAVRDGRVAARLARVHQRVEKGCSGCHGCPYHTCPRHHRRQTSICNPRRSVSTGVNWQFKPRPKIMQQFCPLDDSRSIRVCKNEYGNMEVKGRMLARPQNCKRIGGSVRYKDKNSLSKCILVYISRSEGSCE